MITIDLTDIRIIKICYSHYIVKTKLKLDCIWIVWIKMLCFYYVTINSKKDTFSLAQSYNIKPEVFYQRHH